MNSGEPRPGGRQGPPMGHEKSKNFGKSWKRLIAYCKPFMPAILISLIFASVSTIGTIIGPDKLKEMTNLIMAGMTSVINLDEIFKIAVFLVIVYLASAVLNYIQGVIMSIATQKLSQSLRTSIASKINRMPLGFFDSTTTGDILSRVTNDVDTISQSMQQGVRQLITSVVMIVGSLAMMFITNIPLALVAVVTSVSGFFIISFVMGKSQKYFINRQRHLGEINGLIEEIYTGHNIVKAYNGEEQAKKAFDEINGSLYESNWKSQFFSGLMFPIMAFIGNLSYVAVCILGAVLAMNGYITFGVIVAFMVYIRLFTQPLSQIAQAATSLQSTAAASERVFDFLEEPELSDESKVIQSLDNAHGHVSFDNVSFGYVPSKTIINNFSADIKAGQKIAIVGPTGAGKTTIVNLLMRFYEVNSGTISIDGIPVKELKRHNLHNLFCMVLQDTWIFEGTIKENIIYNKKNISDEQVVSACKAAGIHHFISTLSHGYNTILDDKVSLSAGQKQLLTIARAMIDNAPVLILDEATSSVDTRTEILVQNAMDELTKGRTSFVIAHRLSTIKNADIILVMKDGDIIETGSHNELLEKGGFYADLYNSQFEQSA